MSQQFDYPPLDVLDDLRQHIVMRLGEEVQAELAGGELVLTLPQAQLVKVMRFLRDDAASAFTMLIDACAVDYPERPLRFEMVYHLLSIIHNQRVRVKVAVQEGEAVPSLVEVFPAAGWYEREAFDLYGVLFSGHPDLRRLLTDYGFEGHPLRKDFPLTGFVELSYDATRAAPVYRPVQLQQEYRRFDFQSPWEGMNHPAARTALPSKTGD